MTPYTTLSMFSLDQSCQSLLLVLSSTCSVLQPSSIRRLATPWTYFLHLSLSSVILTDSSTGSPVRVLMLFVQSTPCVVFLACVHLALLLALSLCPGNSIVSSWHASFLASTVSVFTPALLRTHIIRSISTFSRFVYTVCAVWMKFNEPLLGYELLNQPRCCCRWSSAFGEYWFFLESAHLYKVTSCLSNRKSTSQMFGILKLSASFGLFSPIVEKR